MSDSRQKDAWRDLAYTIEVVAGAASSKEDRAGPAAQDPGKREPFWNDLAHTSDTVLASALAREDAVRSECPAGAQRMGRLGRPLRAAGIGVGLMCCVLIGVGHFSQQENDQRRSEPRLPQLADVKRFELVNASNSSAIVQVRLAAPSTGATKVLDLAEPIPPASVQPFWHFPATAAPGSRFCLVNLSASFASGAEADSHVDLCRDDQVLALDNTRPLSPVPAVRRSSRSMPAGGDAGHAAIFSGALLASLDFHADPSRRLVHDARLNADGSKVVTLADDSAVRLWDMATGRQIALLAAHSGTAVQAVTFSPDGREIVTLASDSTAQRWDAETGLELSRHRVQPEPSHAAVDDGYALEREVVLRPDTSRSADAAIPAINAQPAPTERPLPAGSSVGLVQTYGLWALVTTASSELGYVPADALARRSVEPRTVSLGATAKPADAELKALVARIGELQTAGNLALAAGLAQRYAEAVKARYGSSGLHYAGALETLAQLAQASNRLGEAAQLYLRALAIREKASSSCDPKVAHNLDSLAQVNRAQGRVDVADELARRSRGQCAR